MPNTEVINNEVMKSEVSSIIQILQQLHNDEAAALKASHQAQNKRQWQLLIVAAVLFALAVIVDVIYRMTSVAAVLIILMYLVLCSVPIVELWMARKNIYGFLKSPFNGFYQITTTIALLSVNRMDALLEKDIQSLSIVRLLLKNQHDAFVQRIRFVSGPIDKIGILIGLVSALAMLSRLDYTWTNDVAFAIGALFLFSMCARIGLHRVQKNIDILDEVITMKNKGNLSEKETV